jgi:hypothetical protein
MSFVPLTKIQRADAIAEEPPSFDHLTKKEVPDHLRPFTVFC